jgi:hypothetical protein
MIPEQHLWFHSIYAFPFAPKFISRAHSAVLDTSLVAVLRRIGENMDDVVADLSGGTVEPKH